jgi:hypothetical protein
MKQYHYRSPKPKYCPIGRAGNARRIRFGVGTNECDIYTDEEFEFLKAIDRYKTINRRQFVTWPEALAILKSLGYRKEAGNGHEATRRPQAAEDHPLPHVHAAAEHCEDSLCGRQAG